MVDITVTTNYRKVRKKLRLTAREVSAASRNALNRAARSARTEGVRQAARALGVSVKSLRSRVRITSARGTYFVARFRGKEHPLPHSAKKGGRKPAGSAFRATTKKGYTSVWARRTKARYPIEEVRIPVGGKLQQALKKAIDTKGREVYNKRLSHELKRRVARKNR